MAEMLPTQDRDAASPSAFPEEDLLPAPRDDVEESSQRPRAARILAAVGVLTVLLAMVGLITHSRSGQAAISTDGISQKYYIRPPHCKLLAEAQEGDTILEANFHGLSIGDWILIGNDKATGERRRISAFKSDKFIEVDIPLFNGHTTNTHCERFNQPVPAAGPPHKEGPLATTPEWNAWYATTKQPGQITGSNLGIATKANAGQITVVSGAVFSQYATIQIGNPPSQEVKKVTAVEVNTLTLSTPVTKEFPVGTPVAILLTCSSYVCPSTGFAPKPNSGDTICPQIRCDNPTCCDVVTA